MDNSIRSTYKKHHIEKFQGKFININGGCTTLHTKTIQCIKNPDELAIYTYLASKPSTWNINVKEIMSHFGIGRDRIYKALNNLQMRRLITREEIREQGKFVEFTYYLHLEPLPEIKEVVSPFPDLPYTVQPEAVNQETYKEEKLPYKKKNIKKLFLKPIKPLKLTQMDFQEYAHNVPGYEWVGNWLALHKQEA